MTRSRQPSHGTPPLPDAPQSLAQAELTDIEKIEKDVSEELERLTKALGERWLGGPWDARDDLLGAHRMSDLGSIAKKELDTAKNGDECLMSRLEKWSSQLGPDWVKLLVYLWEKCWDLWDRTLAYRTLRVVEEATAWSTGGPQKGREANACPWSPPL